MSSDFTKILVKDDRMECVDNIKYAVIKGGQNVTPSQFKAISTSNNQLVFNIQVPSEQTLIDRRVLLQTDLQLVVTSRQCNLSSGVIAQPSVQTGCHYGLTSGLGPYPLHSLMTVASATINNNTVSINMKDVLPAIIRLLNKKDLGAYNGMTVTATDSLLNYGDSTFGVSPSQGSANMGLDTDYAGRGSIFLKSYTSTAQSAGPYTAGATMTETFTWHISEPLMLSPFIYSNPQSNGQAFYGIQNMNIVLNIGSDLNRVFRGCGPPLGISVTGVLDATSNYASPAGDATAGGNKIFLPWIQSVVPGTGGENGSMFSNTYLLFTFLTAHPSDLFPARNIVPYYELPRYITQGVASVALEPTTVNAFNQYIPFIDTVSGGTTFTSQTLQLNQIPDKLILYIRKQGQTWYDADSYLPITGISIDFNNNSGLLSASRVEDLYRMSKDNGSNQSWNEWVGFQSVTTVTGAGANGINLPINSTNPANGFLTSLFSVVPTVGSCLVLEFGKDIQLIEDFFAPGSLGNFNIRVNLRYQNNNPSIDVGDAIEMVMITMNSGVFVCERGTSSTYTGILTRADVLEASEQDAYTRSDVQRLVGGGFLDMLKSGVSKLSPLLKAVAPVVMPHVKNYLGSKGTLGAMANAGLGAMGYGRSGGGPGGVSGGAMSGGRLQGRYA